MGPTDSTTFDGGRPPTAALVVGTRPEAVKLAPVATALAAQGVVRPLVITTGQHGEVVDDILALFDLAPAAALRLDRPAGERLPRLFSSLVAELDEALAWLDPGAVVVQGDTTTVLAGGQAAFLQGRPVVHVEAGLRSGSLAAPFPEEGNRRMVAAIATLHLAPTAAAEANLLREGHNPASVLVTGNTVIDALRHVADRQETSPLLFHGPWAGDHETGPLVLVTAHRRESWGPGMRSIASAVASLSQTYPDARFVVVTHMNPAVRQIFEATLSRRPNVVLSGPLGYAEFIGTLSRAQVVLTDSGGVQEEAPALGVPVVVLRDRTERVEGVDVGAAVLVGTNPDAIIAATAEILAEPNRQGRYSRVAGLYGDGRAGRRCADAIAWVMGRGARPEPYSGDGRAADPEPDTAPAWHAVALRHG